MKVALDKSYKECLEYDCLQFRTPLTRYRVNSKVPYILDNGCFSVFKQNVWISMMHQAISHDYCLFVVAPDVVGNHTSTLTRFNYWYEKIECDKWCFVLQDGLILDEIPWDKIIAVFVGGSTKFKYSLKCWKALELAKKYDKHIHIGRVNTPERIIYFHGIADTIDGSGLSRFQTARIAVLNLIDLLNKSEQKKLF